MKNKHWQWLLGGSIMIGLVVVVLYLMGNYSAPIKFESTTDIQIDTAQQINKNSVCLDINECIIKGDRLIDENLSKDVQTIANQDVSPGNIQEGHQIAEYKIEGRHIIQTSKNKVPIDKHQMAQKQFDFFTQLVPAEWRKNLTQYVAIEESNLSAYITRLGDKKEAGQALGVDVYNMSNENDQVAKLILIHEFAHLFSDNYDQYVDNKSCEMTITDESLYCLKDNSYLNQFYLAFWKNVPQDWIENSGKETEDIVKFYQLNKDKFITTYAASNPYEDFAESFTEFVVRPYHDLNSSTQADEKIEFFYQYPELVLLRYQLLQNLIR